MKKILISIIVLIVIFSATYFIQQNLLNKDTTPNTETDTSATTTGEPIALSTQDMVKAGNVEFNVDYKISAGSKPTVSGCVGKTYTPRITPQGSNIIGPFPYPVQFTFTGSVDDNLKINGRIVDAGKGVQSGSPCSHRHDLTYTADFPANTPIKIELVDQHGGEVAIKGKVSVVKKETKPVDEFVNVNVDINSNYVFNGTDRFGKIPFTVYLNDGRKLLPINTSMTKQTGGVRISGSTKVKKGSTNWISVAFDNTIYRVASNNCGAAGAQSSPFNCNISNTQNDRTVNMTINRIK